MPVVERGVGRGSTLGHVEQEVAGFLRDSVWSSSGMWVVVRLEKNIFYSWGLVSENGGQ